MHERPLDRLLGPLTMAIPLSLTQLLAACEPTGRDDTPARLECLRGCAVQKDTCILTAQSAIQVQQCDSQNQACFQQCP